MKKFGLIICIITAIGCSKQEPIQEVTIQKELPTQDSIFGFAVVHSVKEFSGIIDYTLLKNYQNDTLHISLLKSSSYFDSTIVEGDVVQITFRGETIFIGHSDKVSYEEVLGIGC